MQGGGIAGDAVPLLAPHVHDPACPRGSAGLHTRCLAGHSNPSTNAIYTHVFRGDPPNDDIAELLYAAEGENRKPELRLIDGEAGRRSGGLASQDRDVRLLAVAPGPSLLNVSCQSRYVLLNSARPHVRVV